MKYKRFKKFDPLETVWANDAVVQLIMKISDASDMILAERGRLCRSAFGHFYYGKIRVPHGLIKKRRKYCWVDYDSMHSGWEAYQVTEVYGKEGNKMRFIFAYSDVRRKGNTPLRKCNINAIGRLPNIYADLGLVIEEVKQEVEIKCKQDSKEKNDILSIFNVSGDREEQL